MRRAMVRGTFVALILSGFISAKGQDRSAASLVGKQVIAIRPDVVFRLEPGDDAEDADFTPSCNPIEIASERGEWLGSSRYWIRRADVVPLSEALEYFTKQIERLPTAYAYVARSRVWRIEKQDLDKSLVDAEAALQLDPKFARAWMSRGECRRKQKLYTEAISDFTRALELDPQLCSALSRRGYAQLHAGDHEGAIADAVAGLKRWPHAGGWLSLRAMTYCNRGILRSSQDEPALAEQDFTRAIEDLHSEQQDLDALEGANRPVTNREKSVVEKALGFAYSLRADRRIQLREFDAAILDCTQAINHRPDYARPYNSRGTALFTLGDREGAMKAYSRALELDPRSASAHLNRAKLFCLLGEVEKAIDDCTAAIASEPDEYEPYYLRGALFASQGGRRREALQDLTRSLALNPVHALSYMNRAVVWCELHEFGKAIEDLTETIRIEPHNWLAYRRRAQIWQAAGNKEDATRDFAEAKRLETLQRAEKSKQKLRYQAAPNEANPTTPGEPAAGYDDGVTQATVREPAKRSTSGADPYVAAFQASDTYSQADQHGYLELPPIDLNDTPPPEAAPGDPPLALDGYSAVTLVELRQWRPGDRRYRAVHGGRLYLFASEFERQAFLKETKRYSLGNDGFDIVEKVDHHRRTPGSLEFGVFSGGQILLFASAESRSQFKGDWRRYLSAVFTPAFQPDAGRYGDHPPAAEQDRPTVAAPIKTPAQDASSRVERPR